MSVVVPSLHSFSKVAAKASAFFLALFSVHVGETLKVAVHPGLQLLSVSSMATVDADGI